MGIKLEKKIILLVEDEERLRKMLELFISGIGFSVIPCPHGRAAIDYLLDVDLLLTDFNMPKMNGAELSILARKYNEKLPIIIMTADPLALPENHFANIVLSKPFELREFSRIIRGMLGGC